MDGPHQSEDVANTKSPKSSYSTPDPKVQVSVRVRASVAEKLDVIQKLWRARAEGDAERLRDLASHAATDDMLKRAEGYAALPEEIDRTYVVDRLLGTAADAELMHLSKGMPETAEQLAKFMAELKLLGKQ